MISGDSAAEAAASAATGVLRGRPRRLTGLASATPCSAAFCSDPAGVFTATPAAGSAAPEAFAATPAADSASTATLRGRPGRRLGLTSATGSSADTFSVFFSSDTRFHFLFAFIHVDAKKESQQHLWKKIWVEMVEAHVRCFAIYHNLLIRRIKKPGRSKERPGSEARMHKRASRTRFKRSGRTLLYVRRHIA